MLKKEDLIKSENPTIRLCNRYVNQDGSFLREKKELEGMEMTKTEPILIEMFFKKYK